MATNHKDVFVSRIRISQLRDKARGSNHVEGSNAEKTLWVVDPFGFEDFSANGNGGVYLGSISAGTVVDIGVPQVRTGLEMTRILASGHASAAALARSRTMLALVLNKSVPAVSSRN
jgi:hypothetical protein